MKILPNSQGGKDSRRVGIRQRILHPKDLGRIDIADSSSDPGQNGSISPWTDMTSLYFDDSIYESEGHFAIKKLAETVEPLDPVHSIEIDSTDNDQHNKILSKILSERNSIIKVESLPKQTVELTIMDDPKTKYRQFDEKYLFDNKQS